MFAVGHMDEQKVPEEEKEDDDQKTKRSPSANALLAYVVVQIQNDTWAYLFIHQAVEKM